MQLDKANNNWRLRIRPTMAIDDGTYLCQISTHPPTILVTNLKIIGENLFLYMYYIHVTIEIMLSSIQKCFFYEKWAIPGLFFFIFVFSIHS